MMATLHPTKKVKSSFVWSDDDDDDDDDDSLGGRKGDHMQRINKINFKLVNKFDEFTSAIDIYSENDIFSNPTMLHFGEEKNLSLVKYLDADVCFNLNVLAQLFPELQ